MFLEIAIKGKSDRFVEIRNAIDYYLEVDSESTLDHDMLFITGCIRPKFDRDSDTIGEKLKMAIELVNDEPCDIVIMGDQIVYSVR